MFPTQLPVTNPADFSRCEERQQAPDPGKSLSPTQKADAALREAIYRAFWKDDVLRAIEYDAVDVHVREGIVHLHGNIISAANQTRIMNAVRTVPGISNIQNHLVLDDRLTYEVAAALADLEHTYECKFFTGASHGVVSMEGLVRDHTVKLLAEQQVAGNPHVRGVINHVHIQGSEPEAEEQPFLQPAMGKTIYFQDGISGIVRQVVVDPDNRRVTAMIVQVDFDSPRSENHPLPEGKSRIFERLIVVPIKTVRYLTKVSGFLHINSRENDQYQDFDPASFSSPTLDWTPPYPYCPEEVLFALVQDHAFTPENAGEPYRLPVDKMPESAAIKEESLANDSLGG